ncbi:MAG: nitrate/nitrite transporter NrtS [Solirubrobacterales bacterium]
MSAREALAICARREHLRSTVSIALVVGTILMLINHFDTIVAGDASSTTWVKVGVTYLVPFTVANLGLLAGKRAETRAARDV